MNDLLPKLIAVASLALTGACSFATQSSEPLPTSVSAPPPTTSPSPPTTSPPSPTPPRRAGTAEQLTELLTGAGFTEIEGDHAIDPMWVANATFDGRMYMFALFQGDHRPETADELLECEAGGLQLDRSLPTELRTQLIELAGCAS